MPCATPAKTPYASTPGSGCFSIDIHNSLCSSKFISSFHNDNRINDMAINQNFPYEKLHNSQSFRLLEIENGDSNCPISCNLRLHSLETAPSYQALSYVWGAPATTNGKSIQCSGHDFFVTENLYEALYRLKEIMNCRLIWVDQICINQNDLQEPSQQVSIMRDIYSGAEIVNSWLGVTN